jgi:hypothetical protein
VSRNGHEGFLASLALCELVNASIPEIVEPDAQSRVSQDMTPRRSSRLDRATRVNALGVGVLSLDSRGLARPLLFWCVLWLACAESGLSAPMQRADLVLSKRCVERKGYDGAEQ